MFARILLGLAAEEPERKAMMIDATYCKAHRTGDQPAGQKGGADA